MEEIYPKNHQEFLEWFRREEDCWDYLYKIRWPKGFVCPICDHDKGWRKRRNLIVILQPFSGQSEEIFFPHHKIYFQIERVINTPT